MAPDLQAVLDEAERAALADLPRAVRHDLPTRDAIVGRLAEIVLGDVLDEILGEPAGPWARERLTRGWDAAVGQPRYGPATLAVARAPGPAAHDDARRGPGARRDRRPASAWDPRPGPGPRRPTRTRRCGSRASWPPRMLPPRSGRSGASASAHLPAARRAAGAIAHLLVLRHAFAIRTFDGHARPWLGSLIPAAAPWGARVGRRSADG